MQAIATHSNWSQTERVKTERTDWAERVGRLQRFWRHSWGLLFVVAMTLLAQYGPRTVYSKVQPAPAASGPAIHGIK